MNTIVGAGYNTIDKLFAITEKDLSNINGIGTIIAKDFVTDINENKSSMIELLKYIKIKTINNTDLIGTSFCFTGSLNSMKRSEAEELVKNKGGLIKSSVTKGLTYLVTNDKDSGSAKNKKAKELKIQIINEKEFLAII
jgi:DNA ligase (NAD+)